MLLDEVGSLLVGSNSSRGSGHDGNTNRNGKLTSLDLVSKTVNDLGLRSNEEHAGLLDLLGKSSVLREESISRVNHGDAMLEGNLLWERAHVSLTGIARNSARVRRPHHLIPLFNSP